MSEKLLITKGGLFIHSGLGSVKIKIVGTSKSVRARRDGTGIVVTVPPAYPLDSLKLFLDKYQEQLLNLLPDAPVFNEDMIIDAPEVDFYITTGGHGHNHTITVNSIQPLRDKKANYNIMLSADYISANPYADPKTQNYINRLLIDCATHAATVYILPRAKDLALTVDRNPLQWKIKYSKRRLGCCSSNGVITLSPALIFLSRELSDFVILHELAHLTEMNHSTAFYTLLNRYTNGREKELRRALKNFHFTLL